ncbi:hypothetical protein [Candidatus Nephthysia bennettiae]|uniref:Uncharacterized protein n=1 Tax=Candidatus Nephthysia bennettiae TaxID=3127016 RepID=A0A934K0S8_9BACT|nr:hypothetical protein [Candidatus Dormibacteraeota bacterium]
MKKLAATPALGIHRLPATGNVSPTQHLESAIQPLAHRAIRQAEPVGNFVLLVEDFRRPYDEDQRPARRDDPVGF